MPAHPKIPFDAGALTRPHYFPYRVYSDPAALGMDALSHGHRIQLACGERLLAAEHPGSCFLVVSGAVASYVCAEGTSTLSAFYLPGSMFLQLSALTGMASQLEYEALEPSVLLCMKGSHLKEAMMADGDLFDRVMRSVSYKMHATREQQRGAKMLDVRERIYILLLGFAKDRGTTMEDGWTRIDWKLTQQDMGAMLGVNRVTVNNALQQLYDSALVKKHGGRYCIRDAAGILETAE